MVVVLFVHCCCVERRVRGVSRKTARCFDNLIYFYVSRPHALPEQRRPDKIGVWREVS